MKKLYYVLFFLSVLAFSCSKDSLLNSDQGTDQLLNNTALKTSGLVITIKPNNTDDTQALIDAFDQAKASGQKAVVKLMPGTFKIGTIDVTEFNGKLAGSGQGKTIITNIWDFPTREDVFQQGKVPALIAFIGGNVEVSDLTVKISELNWVVDPQNPVGMPMLLFSDCSNTYFPSGHHIQVKVNNIELINSDQPGVNFNSNHGSMLFEPAMFYQTFLPRSNIDASVTNSKFSKTNFYVWGCKSGNFVFSGNIISESGPGVHANMGVTVKIIKNIFYKSILDLNTSENSFLEYVSSNVGTYEIRDNIFNESGFGLWNNWRFDHPENPDWMRVLWDHNTINIPVGSVWSAHMFGFKDLIFSNNVFAGDGQSGKLEVYGSWLSPEYQYDKYWSQWTEGVQFLNNVFQQKNFVIELNPTSINCLIKGNLKNVTIIDNGVNNKVVAKTN
jgi:hypothetical protein